MIYNNNYAWPGTTALMYNVWLDNLFNGDGSKKNSSLTDVGFRYKKTSDSNWNEYSIVESGTILINISVIRESSIIYENIYSQRYAIYKNHIYPCRVLIEGLLSNTSYTVESYYVINGEKTFYNSQTISTLPDTSNITVVELAWSTVNPVPDNQKSIWKERIDSATNKAGKILREFCPVEIVIDPVATWQPGAGWAADAGLRFNCAELDTTVEGIRSVTMHEIAHLEFNGNNTAGMIKFMEFATSVERATWKEAGAHNYPIISSERYSYMDDCLVAAACWVSRQNI